MTMSTQLPFVNVEDLDNCEWNYDVPLPYCSIDHQFDLIEEVTKQ